MILLQAADTAQQANGFSLDAGDYITMLVAIISSIITSVITVWIFRITVKKSHDIKSFEVNTDYRKELLNWHSETTHVLLLLKLMAEKKKLNSTDKYIYLARLSSLIEKGRFFFPNNKDKDGWGKEKPLAYQGYRSLILDCLVFYYFLFIREDANQLMQADFKKFIKKAEQLERHFTSLVFHAINPNKYREELKKYIDDNQFSHKKEKFDDDKFFKNFLKHDDDFFDMYAKSEKDYHGAEFDA